MGKITEDSIAGDEVERFTYADIVIEIMSF